MIEVTEKASEKLAEYMKQRNLEGALRVVLSYG
jgi:Fe-S cluster assembly iron-binding protein IscA